MTFFDLFWTAIHHCGDFIHNFWSTRNNHLRRNRCRRSSSWRHFFSFARLDLDLFFILLCQFSWIWTSRLVYVNQIKTAKIKRLSLDFARNHAISISWKYEPNPTENKYILRRCGWKKVKKHDLFGFLWICTYRFVDD